MRRSLAWTSRSNRATVIWFRPPSTSLKRVAPSDLKLDLQLINAASVKTRWAHGATENK